MGIKAYITLVAAAVTAFSAKSDYDIPWNASTVVNAGGGDFAPYFISSNSGGTFTQPAGIYEMAKIERGLSRKNRFEYGFGAEAGASITRATGYSRFDVNSGQWSEQ